MVPPGPVTTPAGRMAFVSAPGLFVNTTLLGPVSDSGRPVPTNRVGRFAPIASVLPTSTELNTPPDTFCTSITDDTSVPGLIGPTTSVTFVEELPTNSSR